MLYICLRFKLVSRWCCVDDKNLIPIIVDVVFMLVNPINSDSHKCWPPVRILPAKPNQMEAADTQRTFLQTSESE